jgi:hypothetical protein
MDSNQPRKVSTAFEYFLYAAILAETLLAAMVYKTIFGSGELVRLRVYFAILYLAFLGWAIAQLNRLHRNRKSMLVPDASPDGQPASEQGAAAHTRPILGLTGEQLVTVALVFATAVAAFTWLLRLLN